MALQGRKIVVCADLENLGECLGKLGECSGKLGKPLRGLGNLGERSLSNYMVPRQTAKTRKMAILASFSPSETILGYEKGHITMGMVDTPSPRFSKYTRGFPKPPQRFLGQRFENLHRHYFSGSGGLNLWCIYSLNKPALVAALEPISLF